ncbi:MAG: 6-bladed beta-propeller [Prevotellaceae bacterium]|jgi:hypothetical protein|nr:6-bladed beta-propeller [Prevotellaceae bacterium]
MKQIILLALIALFLVSCAEQKPKEKVQNYDKPNMQAVKMMQPVPNPDIITIDQENHKTVSRNEFNDMLTDVKYIPIICKEPIGNVDKILVYKDRIFILDTYKAKKVFIFNIKGELIKIIDKRGLGPGEYRQIDDMNIVWNEECVMFTDRRRDASLYYSLDGEFIREERSIDTRQCAFMGNSIVNQMETWQQSDDSPKYHLIVTAKDGSITRKGFPYRPIHVKSPHDQPFLSHNSMGDLLFVEHYSDTVYQILNDSTYKSKYVVKHKKSLWKKYDEKVEFSETFELIRNSGYTQLNIPVLETEKFVSFSIGAKPLRSETRGVQIFDYWYDKTGKTVFTQGDDFSPPITHFVPRPSTVYGNYYVGIFNNDFIESFRDNFKTLKPEVIDAIYQNEDFKSIIKNTNPDLEIMVVLYEFK